MSKRIPTKDVFDQLAEQDNPAEPDTEPSGEQLVSPAEPVAAEDGSDDESTQTTPADSAPPEVRRPGQLRRRVAALVVGAVVVASLGLSAFLGWRLKQVDDTAAAGRAALDAARNYAVTLTTLDANDIDKNFDETLAGATGEFKDAYSQGAAQLRQVLIDNEATGQGLVVDAAVKSATKNRVEVLLFVDQSITNALNPSPRIDRNRVQMTMELVDDHWLASQVEIT